jgi:hypothetical protein
MIYDWNKYDRPRIALFSRVMAWFIAALAILSLPFFIIDALRDWTLIFAWLLIASGAVAQRFGLRKIYRAVPDYAAIAAMEREVYGETFTHEGAPKPDTVAELHAMMDDLADRATERRLSERGCGICGYGAAWMGGMCADCYRQGEGRGRLRRAPRESPLGASLMNWHHWYWWTWPAGIAIGFAWSFVLMCVIPPRMPIREYLRGWPALFLLVARMVKRTMDGAR